MIILAGGFLVLFLSGPKQKTAPVADQASQQVSPEQNLESKTGEQAAVTVTVTPVNISSQREEWEFDVLMNTHSVELDQNILKISALVDNQGKEYKPIRWDGAEAGGHHREGVLIFNRISPFPKSVELKISEIGSVVRSFKWQF